MADVSPALLALPTEIVLLLLSLLDPPSLARCQRVCRHWRQLANEEDVWRRLAIQRAYAREEDACIELVFQEMHIDDVVATSSGHMLLQDLPPESLGTQREREQEGHRLRVMDRIGPLFKSSVTDYFSQVRTFQELCKKKWCLDAEWQCSPLARQTGIHAMTGETFSIPNRLEPVVRSLDAAPPFVGSGRDENDDVIEEVGRDVWRIKIDPKEKVLISTGQRGGIRVVDIRTGEVLWRLDRRMTRHFPHAEFDRGYLIFDRIGHGNFEVWRQSWLGDQVQRRGSFELFASLTSPRPTRALRFQYPILAVATQDGHVLLWDIELQEIVQVISLAGSMHVDANVNYIDFDDDFIFLVGVGAKCVSVVSRKLARVIWTLADHFEAGLPAPETYVMKQESEHIPARYGSLERRQLQRSASSPWQKASGRQNFAQLMMTPVQSWSAVHPDHRSRTLVVLGQTNVLIIRDYIACFLSWQQKKEAELLGGGTPPNLEPDEARSLAPALFADLWFDVARSDAALSLDELPPSQLAVAESRAMCIVGKPMLLDLDPLRMARNDVRSIGLPRRAAVRGNGDTDTEITVGDDEAGFAVYNNAKPSVYNDNAEEAHTSSLDSCSSVMMDSTSVYAVQGHEARLNGSPMPASNLAMIEYHDVLVWDFSKQASKRW